MTSKRIGYYSDTEGTAFLSGEDQFIMEIGHNQVVCLVKGAVSKQTDAFEIFEVDSTQTKDWQEILSAVTTASRLISRSYQDTRVYYNFPEALIVPESKFNKTAAKDYLEQVYGDSNNDPVGHERLSTDTSMVTVYQVKKQVNEWVKKQFPLHQAYHIYSGFLNDLFGRSLPEGNFTAIRFYGKHAVIAVIKDRKLQIIQSFQYEVDEDVLYVLLSMIRQFDLNPDFSNAEISGELDKDSSLAKQLPALFGNITWDSSEAKGIFSSVLSDHPAHYFTPYSKLVV